MAVNRVPYGTSLRVLGRLLNGDKARMVTVCEIEQGFLLHYFVQGDPCQPRSRAIHNAEVLNLDEILQGQRGQPEPTGSFKALQSIFGFRQSEALRFQKSHPLCSAGYEHMLRAVGAGLDRRGARAVLVTELETALHVEYTVDRADFVLRDGQRMALPGRRAERYTGAQIEELIRKAREHAVERVRASGQNLSFNPMDVASYLSAAHALEDDGHYQDAEDLYQQAVRLVPEHADIHYHLARHARRRGDRKAALKHVQRALALHGDDGRFLHLLGRLNMERGHLTAAAEALHQAIARDPGNSIYQFDLDQVRERLGPDADAYAQVEAAIHNAASPINELWPMSPTPTPIPAPVPLPVAPLEMAPSPEWETTAPAEQEPSPSAWEATPAPFAAVDRDGLELATPLQEPSVPVQRRSLAARLAGRNGSQLALPPASSRDETPLGEISVAPAPTTFPATSEVVAQSEESGLPVLGLAAAHDWTTPTLPAIHVPSDAAAAAAALPLAVTSVPVSASLAGPASAPPPPPLPLSSSMVERAEPELVPHPRSPSDDAAHLATAIKRAEELVRAEPQRADLHRRLGFLLAKQGRSEEAAAEFRQAAECGRRRLTG